MIIIFYVEALLWRFKKKLTCFHLRSGGYKHTKPSFTVRDSPRLKTCEIGRLALKFVLQEETNAGKSSNKTKQ